MKKIIYSMPTCFIIIFLVLLCGCTKGGGGKQEDLSSGLSEVTRNLLSGEAALIEGKESQLTIPADTLMEPISIVLSEKEAELREIGEGLTSLSPQVNVGFSKAIVTSNKVLTLKIRLDKNAVQEALAAGQGLYFYIKKTEGIDCCEFSGTSNWTLQVAEIDDLNFMISIPFYSTAGEINVVPVAGPPLLVKVSGNLETQLANSTTLKAMTISQAPVGVEKGLKSISNEEKPGEKRNVENYCGYKWAVYCLPQGNEKNCTQSNIDLLTRHFVNMCNPLANLTGLTNAVLRQVSLSALKKAGNVTGSVAKDTEMVNLVQFGRSDQLKELEGAPARYDNITAMIYLSEQLFDMNLEDFDIVAHEICHANGFSYMPNVTARWILEGTAQLCNYWKKTPPNINRQWNFSLEDAGLIKGHEVLPYQTLEFWKYACSGDLHCIGDIYKGLATTSADDRHSLIPISLALKELGWSLEDIFDNFVLELSLTNYPFCQPVVSETINENVGLEFQSARMSAICQELDLIPDQTSGCIRMTTSAAGGGSLIPKWLINGVPIATGNKFTFNKGSFTGQLWLINQDPGNLDTSNYVAEFSPSQCLCGNSVIDGDAGEQCDDGNEASADGCSANCQNEASPPSSPPTSSTSTPSSSSSSSTPSSTSPPPKPSEECCICGAMTCGGSCVKIDGIDVCNGCYYKMSWDCTCTCPWASPTDCACANWDIPQIW